MFGSKVIFILVHKSGVMAPFCALSVYNCRLFTYKHKTMIMGGGGYALIPDSIDETGNISYNIRGSRINANII